MEEVEYIKSNAVTQYYIKGTLITHRDDGPAVIYADGDKEWYQYGKRHRLDGPAAIYISPIPNNKRTFWYFNDQKITCSNLLEFQRMIKLLAFV
jgi:hypothetical protein